MSKRLFLILFLLQLAPIALADEEQADATAGAGVTEEQAAFFETRIRPVLVERCLDCHSGDEPENGLDLESRAGMLRGGRLGRGVVPGKPAESLLISALKHDEFIKMPPKEKLPTRQVADFTKWVEMGAPWPDSVPRTGSTEPESLRGVVFSEEQETHWSFQPVDNPVPPKVDSAWPQSAIDHFVLARLQASGLQPCLPLDKRTLIRRAAFDLTGLPPTPAEVGEFLRDDSPDAFAKVVDRLLDSPKYGERWARHWLDVARYADSNGLDENLSYANAFRYRDYVIRAFNHDKPYGRFIQEQIAGDLLPECDDERENLDRFIATGFLAIGPKMLAEDDPVKMQMDIIDEQINTLGQAFMGLTIGCARCHDHKFDPLPAEDYYSLAGIFKSSKTMENHKVVAVWYERPLVSQKVTTRIERIDQQIAENTQQIATLKSDVREEIAEQMQSQLSQYLLASAASDRFQRQVDLDRPALSATDSAHRVRNGYALIEAEAFHRGNVVRVNDGYGEGIGIIATSGAGFAEYDVDVDRAGTYALEMRFTAADSRALKLLVNDKPVFEAIASEVTGSWYPDGQRWFAIGDLEFEAGQNTIKFDSPRVYPHIDRLAIVYRGPEAWPFGDSAPPSITQIESSYTVNPKLVWTWQKFLHDVEDEKLKEYPSFETWLEFSRIDEAKFAEDAKGVIVELSSAEGIGATTPLLLKQQLLGASLDSLEDVADVYQELLATLDDPELSGSDLKSEWFRESSPLLGPPDVEVEMLSAESSARLETLQQKAEQLKASRPVYGVAMGITEGTAEDLRIHLRGSHIALGEVAPRRFPRILSNHDQTHIGDQQSGRLQLANWLSDPEHPLVARVIVNRVWHWRFGRGLSPTVDNFGLLGQAPTHPQLLDWMARRFTESGGSLKELHRMMMLSSTYQMSTKFDEEANVADPEDSLLWRFRRRRLSAEEMRDAIVELGTGLNQTMGGSLLKVKNRSYVTGSGTNITDEYDNQRRSVYLPVVRSSVYEVLQTLDFPDPAVPAGERQTSTVAPQALLMMNSELVEAQTMALATNLQELAYDEDRVRTAFENVLNRSPRSEEMKAGIQYINLAMAAGSFSELTSEEAALRAWQSYCRVLLSSNEFAYVE